MSIKEEKAALRREIKQRIRALSKEDIKSQSISACKLAAGLIAFKNARTILSYRALPGECNPAELVKAAASMGKNVAYPVCGGDGGLELYIPSDGSCFVRGAYGIAEPDRERSETDNDRPDRAYNSARAGLWQGPLQAGTGRRIL